MWNPVNLTLWIFPSWVDAPSAWEPWEGIIAALEGDTVGGIFIWYPACLSGPVLSPRTQDSITITFFYYFLYFCYMKMVSNSFVNGTTRFFWFTRFQRWYIHPDPCTVGGDTGIRNLPAFCLPILVPHPNTVILVISLSYRMCHISTDRYLRDEYDYGENVGIGSWVTEKLSNYFPYLEKTLCF